MNDVHFKDLLRLKDIFEKYQLAGHIFLERLLYRKFELLAHVDEAELVEVKIDESTEIKSHVVDQFLPVYIEKVYQAFVNGVPLRSNFLMTSKPIEDWLPGYPEEGLVYACSPSEIDVFNLFVRKSELEHLIQQSKERHDDQVIFKKDWSIAVIGGKHYEMSERLAFVLKVLRDSIQAMAMPEILKDHPEHYKMDNVLKPRASHFYQLVEFGNGGNFPKGRYRASEMLKNSRVE